jgi:hypothetical protein
MSSLAKSLTNSTANDLILAGFSLSGSDLINKFPPQFHTQNKANLWNYVKEQDKTALQAEQILHFSRYKPMKLPQFLPAEHAEESKIIPTLSAYSYPLTAENAVEFYVNFADSRLFGFYGSNLLAQDEHQALEHPVLGSVREYIKANSPNIPNLKASTRNEHNESTPCVILNARRNLAFDTVSSGLYGNKFSVASFDNVKEFSTILSYEKAKQLELNAYNNILAIEAPKHGRGGYSKATIQDILVTTYTGFLACKLEANREAKLNNSGERPREVIIHTGNLGCGAYGGNGVIMAILQIAAAKLAGINTLFYHTFDNKFNQLFIEGEKKLNNIWPKEHQQQITMDQFIEAVEKLKLQWGVGNGT